MAGKQRMDPCVPVTVFERVVPSQLLEHLNESINATRQEWRPPDGRRASAQALQFAELLRTTQAFLAMETQVRAVARHWSASTFGCEPSGEPHYVLRCVNREMTSQSYLRHFDSHVLTVLVPLQSAETHDQNGDLIVRLKPREGVSVLAYAAIKTWLFLEHRFPFALRRVLIALDGYLRAYERIHCVPGNAYVFNGFVTLHHNLHVASGERRSLIIHYYNPGLATGAHTVVHKLRAFRDWAGDWL